MQTVSGQVECHGSGGGIACWASPRIETWPPRAYRWGVSYPVPTVNDSASSPAPADEPRRVTAVEAYELLGAGRAVLLDVREPANYENAHAGGAVSVPHVALQASAGRLPARVAAPEDALLILYCG